MKNKAARSQIIYSIAIFALTFDSNPSVAASRVLSGYFETEPGVVGERNRLCISPQASDTYLIEIQTISCPTVSSGDCSNAKKGDIAFSAKLKNGKLNFHETGTNCQISIAVKNKTAFVSQSLGKCKDQFPYDDAGGVYVKKKTSPGENDCAP